MGKGSAVTVSGAPTTGMHYPPTDGRYYCTPAIQTPPRLGSLAVRAATSIPWYSPTSRLTCRRSEGCRVAPAAIQRVMARHADSRSLLADHVPLAIHQDNAGRVGIEPRPLG